MSKRSVDRPLRWDEGRTVAALFWMYEVTAFTPKPSAKSPGTGVSEHSTFMRK
jgi:hypothetical protein